jgi:type II secretory pathway component PulF
VTGAIAASNEVEVDTLLLSRGLHPIALAPATPGPAWIDKPGRRDLAIVFRSLSTLVNSGVPLERALCASARLPRQPTLRATLAEARRLLVEGQSFANALISAEGRIPPVVVGVLRAGERGSRLGLALEQAASQLEQEADLESKVRQALTYPAILLLAGTCSLGVITTSVVPRFAVILADAGQALPPATRMLLGISHAASRYGLLVCLLLASGLAFLISWARSPQGRMNFHGLLLRLGLIGTVRSALASARVCRALGAQLAAGVPILTALEASREAAGDAEIATRIARVARRVGEGEPVTASFESERAIIPLALQLLAVGEASGQLGVFALRAGDLAATESARGLQVLVSLLEPSLVVLFGGMVAFTAAALLQAVYSLRPG